MPGCAAAAGELPRPQLCSGTAGSSHSNPQLPAASAQAAPSWQAAAEHVGNSARKVTNFKQMEITLQQGCS